MVKPVNALTDQSKVKMGICYKPRRFRRLFLVFVFVSPRLLSAVVSSFPASTVSFHPFDEALLLAIIEMVMANEEDVIIYICRYVYALWQGQIHSTNERPYR